MKSLRIALALLITVVAAAPAAAQNQPSRFQVSLYPNSRIFATGGGTQEQPKFKSYTPGASLTMALGRRFALEADIAGSLGRHQSMGMLGRKKSPALLGGTINGVVGLMPGNKVQPYLTAGLGVIRLFKREELGMTHGETLESANVGAGVKVMFSGWGIRADYRFVGMDSAEQERSTFFGPKVRHAHRIAVGFVIGDGR